LLGPLLAPYFFSGTIPHLADEEQDQTINLAGQNKIVGMNEIVALPSNDDFGVSTKITGAEGGFALVVTDDIGGVYVAYQSHWAENNPETMAYHVYFAYSHDYGENWSQSFRVNDNASSSVQCDSPSIAIDLTNGHIFVAWKDNRTGVAHAYLDKSVDRGVSFGSDTTVYDWPNDHVPPWLPYTINLEISDNGAIYVAWIGYYGKNEASYSNCNIFFTHSIDGGLTFSDPIIVKSTSGEARLAHPWVEIESNNVLYLVYTRRDATSADVFLAKSQDGGSTFETPVKVTDAPTQRYCGGPQVVVSSDGTIHVVWTDSRAGDGTEYLDIYYATSLDGGLSFGPNLRVNDDLVVTTPDPNIHPHFTRGAQGTPTIAIDSNSKVHIVWEDFRNFVNDITYCRDIYYASPIDNGQFSDNLKVNYVHSGADSVNCADPNIAIDSQDVFFLVYSDAPSGDNDHHSIHFMMIPNVTKLLSETPSSEFSLISKEQSYEKTSSSFGFQLIPMVTAFLIAFFFPQKKTQNRK
jgi:hypothetical protein